MHIQALLWTDAGGCRSFLGAFETNFNEASNADNHPVVLKNKLTHTDTRKFHGKTSASCRILQPWSFPPYLSDRAGDQHSASHRPYQPHPRGIDSPHEIYGEASIICDLPVVLEKGSLKWRLATLCSFPRTTPFIANTCFVFPICTYILFQIITTTNRRGSYTISLFAAMYLTFLC